MTLHEKAENLVLDVERLLNDMRWASSRPEHLRVGMETLSAVRRLRDLCLHPDYDGVLFSRGKRRPV